MPIIPAIPRSLEKRKVKEHVRSSQDRGGTGSPVLPTSHKEEVESLVESTVPQSQAVPNGALGGSNEKDDVKENDMQEAIVERGSKEVAQGKSAFQGQSSEIRQKPTTSEDSTTSIPNHPQDFGIEKHGFRLPPPFYPNQPPPLAISTDVSPANEPATASEETSQTVEEENGSSMSQQSSIENHVTLNATAPTFHAHPTPPTDVTTSPAELSSEGPNPSQSSHIQHEHEPTQPTATLSPIHLPYEGYEVSQNISFYASPQSSDDPSSPNHSIYQGYAYAPTSYGYSPQAHTSQQQIESPQRNEGGVFYEQRYEPQPSFYSNQSYHPVLGSHPPLTPSRTPLDASAQSWSYSNGLPPTVPYGYGYVPAYHPQPTFEPPMRSASQGTKRSDESNRKADLLEERSHLVQLNTSEMKATEITRGAWRDDNDCMSSHMPLVEHLLRQFNIEEFADCHLTLVHENLRFEKTTWSLSSLLLAQSPILQDLLKSAGTSKEGKMSLEVRLTDRFVTPWAMNLALRALYGECSEVFSLAIVHSSFGLNAEMWALSMDACLAFAAAGQVLGLESVVSKGLQTASSILDWDNLEHALSFGLESGPNRGTIASVDVIPLYAGSPVWSRESDPSSATNLTPPSSSTESRHERFRVDALSSGISQPSEVRSASDLQTYCLQWIASKVDESWEFDPSARPLAEIDRLPTTAESRSPLSKSRLSRIQFGEHPSENHVKANDRNVLVSSIVLSLPFVALKYTLNLGSQPLLRQLSTIVKERERRRQIVLQSKSVPWTQRFAAKEHEWAEVGYTEWVETTGDGHVALARTFTGIDRQVSEPSTPGKKKS